MYTDELIAGKFFFKSYHGLLGDDFVTVTMQNIEVTKGLLYRQYGLETLDAVFITFDKNLLWLNIDDIYWWN